MAKVSQMNVNIYRPINYTFIATIPKDENLVSLDSYRLMSLFNCLYKIIAKVIVGRLKPILSKTISRKEFEFLEGRHIFYTIWVPQ